MWGEAPRSWRTSGMASNLFPGKKLLVGICVGKIGVCRGKQHQPNGLRQEDDQEQLLWGCGSFLTSVANDDGVMSFTH